jgi:hypothetical protein
MRAICKLANSFASCNEFNAVSGFWTEHTGLSGLVEPLHCTERATTQLDTLPD